MSDFYKTLHTLLIIFGSRKKCQTIMNWTRIHFFEYSVAKEQFYYYTMSKFHKTTYSRQPNLNMVNSSHGKRNALYEQTHQAWGQLNKVEMPIERKIDIEPNLLFTQKNYPKPSHKNNQIQYRQPANRSEAKFYETSIGFSQGRDRPQSKQEPRPKGDAKIRTEVFLPERPQSSKGVRSFRGNEARERQVSEHDEEFPIHIKVTDKKSRNIQSSYSRKSTNQSNMLAFETSIDPEFLSLFAN